MSTTPVMMNRQMILFLLEELSYETVVEETDGFKYRIQKKGFGYREAPVGVIQAALSIGLEMAQKKADAERSPES